jgi:hypothetical protein
MSEYLKFLCIMILTLILAGCGKEGIQEPHTGSPLHAVSESGPNGIEVVVTYPDGGEVLSYQDHITWTATAATPILSALLKIDIDCSVDGGTSWWPLARDEFNIGTYWWELLHWPSGENYLMRVTATDTSGSSGSDISDEFFSVSDRVYLTDITGKKWDITHAYIKYGMHPDNWNHGLGPFHITPINDPYMITHRHPDFPDDTYQDLVIGTDRPDGKAKAYPISVLYSHEVVNEDVGGIPFAVLF